MPNLHMNVISLEVKINRIFGYSVKKAISFEYCVVVLTKYSSDIVTVRMQGIFI